MTPKDKGHKGKLVEPNGFFYIKIKLWQSAKHLCKNKRQTYLGENISTYIKGSTLIF